MNTCDTCKWWAEPDSDPRTGWPDHGVVKEVLGRCVNKLKESESGFYRHFGTDHQWPKEISEDAFSPEAEECNVGASLFTGPKFGCVHWEAK